MKRIYVGIMMLMALGVRQTVCSMTITMPYETYEELQKRASIASPLSDKDKISDKDKKEERAKEQMLVCLDPIFQAKSGRKYDIVGGRLLQEYATENGVYLKHYVDITKVHASKLRLLSIFDNPIIKIFCLLGVCVPVVNRVYDGYLKNMMLIGTSATFLVANWHIKRKLEQEIAEDSLLPIELGDSNYIDFYGCKRNFDRNAITIWSVTKWVKKTSLTKCNNPEDNLRDLKPIVLAW